VHFVYNSDITLYSQRKVSTLEISPFFTLRPNKKDLSFSEKSLMVELVENSLHPILAELERWESIIGEHYLDYKLQEERNRLAYRP
jgi:tyrosine-protein phosphatase YwqE